MEIKITISKDEFNLFNNYANYKGVSIENLLKETIINIIEDEIDLQVIKEYEKEKENNKLEIKSFDYVLEMINSNKL